MHLDDNNEFAELEKRLGYSFQDPDNLAAALRHSSYVHENPGEGPSNERLEFLGDAVLELVITEFLYHRFPQATEGRLSKARSGVVLHRSAARRTQRPLTWAGPMSGGAAALGVTRPSRPSSTRRIR